MSPFLYLMVVEALDKLLLDVRATAKFKGLKITMFEFISHLLSIDDVLLFVDGSLQDIQFLNQTLFLLYKATNMVINVSKTSLLSNGLTNEVNALVDEFLP